jgi:hypothetical protein
MRICGLRRRSVHTRSRRHPIFKSALAVSLSFALCPASFADVIVNLDATSLPAGPVATWTNSGTLGDVFTNAGPVVPQVTTIAGGTGISFIGGTGGGAGTHYVGPIAPASVTGASSRSVEAWVYNPSPQGEEAVFAWGRRGGPDGSNVSFNHSTDATFGAVGHWGAGPDIGWANQIQFSRWTYIVYTWDSASQTTALYKDGQPANSETGVILNTHTTSDAGAPLRFRVARQSAAGGGPSGVGVGEITIGRIRVHDVVLDATTVAATFETERAVFGLADDDGDGLPNGYELLYPGCLGISNALDAILDCDADNLTNIDEFQRGTNPTNADSDGDGANDGAEVNRMDGGVAAPTNPLRADSDGDNLLDGVETDTGTFVSRTDTGTDPLIPDTDADGYTDGHEVVRQSNPTDLNSVPNLVNPSPLISLDATTLPPGPLGEWTNSGALGGLFRAPAGAIPAVTTVQETNGVTFNGTTHFYTGPVAPSFITGSNALTIEAWVYNPAVADEETVFSWARRGGPDGSNMSFNHGVNPTFGAVGHWGGPDVGWGASSPIAGRWTFIAYAYNPATGTGTAYRDGAVANTDTVGILNMHGVNNTPSADRLPFRVASQNEPDGSPTAGLRGAMTIARIRVYEVTLDDITITNHFTADAETFGLADNDGDGMLNGYERQYSFLDPNNPADAAMDQDSDGATNLEEFRARTNPTVADTDGDGINDGPEIHRVKGVDPAPTDPLRADTDLDGLRDNVETDTGVFVSAANTGTDPRVADTDGDTFADGQEVFHTSDPTLTTATPDFDFTPPLAIVNLNATSLPLGALATWTNSGALGGLFVPDAVVPQVATVEGVKGVQFLGTDEIYTGPIAPIFLTGANNRTVEAWIYNPGIAPEENIFSWGRRGGPDGSNMSFNHGTDAVFGAAGHWGTGPDVGWSGNISTSRWTFVAYTYDRATATVSVYRDGQLANSEGAITLNTHLINSTPATNGLPFRVATQNDANGTATVGLRGSMTIARIRVYDEALPATGDDSIQAHYQAESGDFATQLRLSIAYDRGANTATITWTAAPGASYAVQGSPDLSTWTDRGTAITTGTFTDNQATGTRFYRVRVE